MYNLETKVSYFTAGIRSVKPAGTVSIRSALADIQNSKFEAVKEYADGKKEKSDLPYFTFSGTFKYRNNAGIQSHSGLLQIDIDRKLNPSTDFRKLSDDLACDPYLLTIFCGPSGYENGVKGLLRVENITNNDEQNEIARQAESYFSEIYGVKIDPACKDLARACFVTNDPDLHLSPDAKFFPGHKPLFIPETLNFAAQSPKNGTHWAAKLAAEKVAAAPDGSKHTTVRGVSFWLGGFVGSGEIPESEAVQIISDAVDTLTDVKDRKLAQKTIESGIAKGAGRPLYSKEFFPETQIFSEFFEVLPDVSPKNIKNPKALPTEPLFLPKPSADYHSLFEEAALKMQAMADAKKSFLQVGRLQRAELLNNTPFFDDSIFSALPKYFQKILAPYSDNRRVRDICLLGMFSSLSACFPDVFFWNDLVKEVPKPLNLFSFLSVGPASGKGNIAQIRKICDAIDRQRSEDYKNELIDFELNKDSYPKSTPPPIQKFLFLTGQMTDAALTKFLAANRSLLSVILEADQIVTAMKSQHGGAINATLRNVYEGEPAGKTTAGEGRTIIADGKTLGLTIASTPDQMAAMFADSSLTANGLFSRFVAYMYALPKVTFELDETLPGEQVNISNILQNAAEELLIFSKIKTVFYRTKKQTKEAKELGQAALNYFQGQFPEGAQFPLRLMQAMFRMASLMSIFYYIEDGTLTLSEYTPLHPEAFKIAVSQMFPILLEHKKVALLYMLDSANEEPAGAGQITRSKVFEIANAMTEPFTAKELITQVASAGIVISARQVRNYLDEMTADKIFQKENKPRGGKYSKL